MYLVQLDRVCRHGAGGRQRGLAFVLQGLLMSRDPVGDGLGVDRQDTCYGPQGQAFQVQSHRLLACLGVIAGLFGLGRVVLVTGRTVKARTVVLGLTGFGLAPVTMAMRATRQNQRSIHAPILPAMV